MAKPLIEIIGNDRVEEVLAEVREELKPHLKHLFENIELISENGLYALRLNDKVSKWFSYMIPKEFLHDRVEAFLSKYALKHGVEEYVSDIAFYIANELNLWLKRDVEDVYQVGEETIRVIASDGVSVPAASVYYSVGDKLLIGEITYANVTVQKIGKKAKF